MFGDGRGTEPPKSVRFPAGVNRPLFIAEIVDRSVTLGVQRWRVLLLLALVESVPIGVLRMLVPERPAALMLVWWVPDVAAVAWLYGAAALATAAPDVPSLTTVLRASARRYGALLAAMVIAWLYVGLIAVAILLVASIAIGLLVAPQNRVEFAVVGGVVTTVGSVVFLPRAALAAMIVMPIVALENVGPWSGFRTALRRVRSAGWWRAWLLGLALFAISVAPLFVMMFALESVAPIVPALKLVEEFLADAVSIGAGIVVATVIAIEMRVRHEGSDLEDIATRDRAI